MERDVGRWPEGGLRQLPGVHRPIVCGTQNREALEAIRRWIRTPWSTCFAAGLSGIGSTEKRKGDFREYFVTRALARAFRGDSARHRFWMRLRREMLDVTRGFAGDTEWSLIDFPGFSVLEFFKIRQRCLHLPGR